MVLLFGNKTEQDILLRRELELLQPRLKLHFILDQPPPGWQGLSGLITEQALLQVCPLDDP